MEIDNRKHMKKVITALFFVTTIVTQAQDVNWLPFERAIELNKTEPKPILVSLHTDWCGFCKRMDSTTYKNSTIVKYINDNFYAVKLDGEESADITFKGKTFKLIHQGRGKYHELAAAILNGKMSYPATAFFNSQEQHIQTIPGYLTDKKFEVILAYFKESAYKTTPWSEFEKNFKSNM